jgi:hypothetical protein
VKGLIDENPLGTVSGYKTDAVYAEPIAEEAAKNIPVTISGRRIRFMSSYFVCYE